MSSADAALRDAVVSGVGRAWAAARYERARADGDAGARGRQRAPRPHPPAPPGLQRVQAHKTAAGRRGHAQQPPAGTVVKHRAS